MFDWIISTQSEPHDWTAKCVVCGAATIREGYSPIPLCEECTALALRAKSNPIIINKSERNSLKT